MRTGDVHQLCENAGGAPFGCGALSLEVRVDLATTAEANRVDLIFTRNIDNMIGNNNSQCMAVVRCHALILMCVYARGCTKLRVGIHRVRIHTF
jgi:hypothetical protein